MKGTKKMKGIKLSAGPNPFLTPETIEKMNQAEDERSARDQAADDAHRASLPVAKKAYKTLSELKAEGI